MWQDKIIWWKKWIEIQTWENYVKVESDLELTGLFYRELDTGW